MHDWDSNGGDCFHGEKGDIFSGILAGSEESFSIIKRKEKKRI